MSVPGICTHSYPLGLDWDHLSISRFDSDDFGLFFGNFGLDLANLTQEKKLNTLKPVSNHAHMSFLGIYNHSLPFWVCRNHLCDPRWDIDDFGQYFSNSNSNLTNLSPKKIPTTLKPVYDNAII